MFLTRLYFKKTLIFGVLTRCLASVQGSLWDRSLKRCMAHKKERRELPRLFACRYISRLYLLCCVSERGPAKSKRQCKQWRMPGPIQPVSSISYRCALFLSRLQFIAFPCSHFCSTWTHNKTRNDYVVVEKVHRRESRPMTRNTFSLD